MTQNCSGDYASNYQAGFEQRYSQDLMLRGNFRLRNRATILLLVCAASMGNGVLSFACGNEVNAVPGTKAQLVLHAQTDVIHVDEQIWGSLIFPRGLPLQTGILERGPCELLRVKVQPPTGWHDPWRDWYNSGISRDRGDPSTERPFVCGVSAGQIPAPPPQINFNFTNWIQFDRPGKYVISALYRAYRRSGEDMVADPYDEKHSGQWVVLETEPIEISVQREQDLAPRIQAQLEYARHIRSLDGQSVGLPPWAAYSQSKDVVPLLTEFFDPQEGRRGVISNPNRELVVTEMEKQIAAPKLSISVSFIEFLAFSKLRLEHPELFGEALEDPSTPNWEVGTGKRRKEFAQLLADYTKKVALAVPSKEAGAARYSLDSAFRVLEKWELPGSAEIKSAAVEELLRLIATGPDFDSIVTKAWSVTKSPQLIQLIRRRMTEHNFPEAHWLPEIAPNEVRRSYLEAVSHDDWDRAARFAESMADDETRSPLVDRHLAQALRQADPEDDESYSRLNYILMKAGGRGVLPTVHQILASQSCLGNSVLWNFVLQREGESAERRLLQRYRRLLSDPVCNTVVRFQHLLQGYWSPRIEEIVVAQLDDKYASVRSRAATLLGQYGSPETDSILWGHLDRYHERYEQDRNSRPAWSEELELLTAIWENPRSHHDPETLSKLKSLCILYCDRLAFVRSSAQSQPIQLEVWEQLTYKFSSLRERGTSLVAVEEWTSEFPQGTAFRFTQEAGRGMSVADAELLAPGLVKFLRSRGMRLEEPPGYDSFGRCAVQSNRSVQ